MNQLGNIISVFKKFRKESLPVAIIQNGSLENEKKAVGTLLTIEEIVKANNIKSPAIIVIGEVINQAK